jgi:hypothetical protein
VSTEDDSPAGAEDEPDDLWLELLGDDHSPPLGSAPDPPRRQVALDLDLDPGPFVGGKEAIEILGLDRTTFYRLAPEPFQQLKMGAVWLAQDIRDLRDELDREDRDEQELNAPRVEIDGVPTRRRGRGRPRGSLSRKSREIRRVVLEELVPVYDTMTVRQVFYRLVGLGVVPKEEGPGYQSVQAQVLRMRREGVLPWEFIADGTRLVRMASVWDDKLSFIEDIQSSYRRDLWRSQNLRIEIWLEKDALAEVVVPVTWRWRVPLMVSRGQSSATFLHTAAMFAKAAWERDRTQTVVYALYDHDAGGARAARAIARDLPALAGPDVPVRFERLALVQAQITAWGLPTRPPKPTDPEAHKWGNRPAVELDAIPPDQLTQLVDDAIKGHIEPRAWEIEEAIERSERNDLSQLADRLADEDEDAKPREDFLGRAGVFEDDDDDDDDA